MGRHTAPSDTRTASRPVAAVVAPIVAVAGIAGGVYAASRTHGTDATAANAADVSTCAAPTHVRVTAPSDVAPVIRALTAGTETKAGVCIAYDVTDRDSQTTARAIAVAAADAPQIWITDSPLWVDRVNQTLTQTPLAAGTPFATSPIGIAVPGALAAAGVPTGRQSLAQLFAANGGKLPLRVADPETSSASLLGTTAALGVTGKDEQATLGLARTMVGASHSWSTEAELQLLAGTGGDKAAIFPATEQQIFRMNKTYPQAPVQALSFKEGDPTLAYSAVAVPGAKAADPRALTTLTGLLTSATGTKALTDAGFRVGASAPNALESFGAAKIPAIPLTIDQVDTAVRVTDAVSLDMNLLTVMDVTGSMKEPAIGNLNRAQVATQAVQKAVALFPQETRFGLWEFADKINGPTSSVNHRQVLPIAPLSDKAGNVSHKDAALGALQAMPGHLSGGTPLYDTVLAAYKAIQEKSSANETSALVLVTDGKNEIDRGIDLDTLLSELGKLKDPKRPVKVALVGIGQQADMPTLRTIAKAVDGAAYNASNPADIPNVVFDALAQRVTVATQL